MNGFLNILKPPGMTSAAVVACVRRLTGEKRVGHAGTLDPEAAGVLPVMVGRAARLFDYLVDKEKEYVAEVAFGAATDTQDATGQVIATGTNVPDQATIEAALPRLTGEITQRPSLYSAIKKDGKPLYLRARQGEDVEVPERQVWVGAIELGQALPRNGWMLRVRCGRGTYIRSLCDDLGKLVGCPAHMRFLLRSRSGAFDLDTALTLEEAQALSEAGTLGERLLPLDWPLGHLPVLTLPDRLADRVQNGVRLTLPPSLRAGVAEEAPLRVVCAGRFWGIAVLQGGQLNWRVLFPMEEEETKA